MSDKAYENAIRRRDELAREINGAQQRIDAFRSELRGVDTFLEQWRKFAGVEGPRAGDSYTENIRTAAIARKNPKKEDVADAAYEIIQEHGEPMARSELYKRLIERGMVLNGSDPEMVLSTMLWRMQNRIKRLKKGGYWLADIPFKGGGMDPYFANQEIDEAIGTIDNSEPTEVTE
jgi:hypothetical protein